MKITAEQFVESLARMSDAEKQKAANLLVNDQLMGLTISQLTQVQSMISDIKTMKAKSAIIVGGNVFVVQKTKKTPGIVEKVNQTRAIVNMKGRSYNVPFAMLEAA